MTTHILETDRLNLRQLGPDDAGFLLDLLNQPSYWQYIGDRGVRTPEDARQYIEAVPVASYAQHGHGLWLVERKADGTPMGLCGLIKRDLLEDPDLGYAFLPAYWSQGYAAEAAAAVLAYGHAVLGLPRIVAIVSPENYRSIKLLEKLGLRFERMIKYSASEVVMLFSQVEA